MRILTTSDPHGCYDPFMKLLEGAKYNPAEDKLFLLGDYCDRGPKTKEVIEKVIELVEKDKAVAIMGNHDDWFIRAILGSMDEEEYNNWLSYGGKEAIDSYKGDRALMKKHAVWMAKNLRPYAETEEYIFVHAGVVPNVPIEKQNPVHLMWTRHNARCNLGKIIVHGHTPMKEVTEVQDQLFIDTGGVFGNKFTLVDLTNNILYEVKDEQCGSNWR